MSAKLTAIGADNQEFRWLERAIGRLGTIIGLLEMDSSDVVGMICKKKTKALYGIGLK